MKSLEEIQVQISALDKPTGLAVLHMAQAILYYSRVGTDKPAHVIQQAALLTALEDCNPRGSVTLADMHTLAQCWDSLIKPLTWELLDWYGATYGKKRLLSREIDIPVDAPPVLSLFRPSDRVPKWLGGD